MNSTKSSIPLKHNTTSFGVSGKAHVYPLIPSKDLRLLKSIFDRLRK